MSILILIKTPSNIYIILRINHLDISVVNVLFLFIIDIFYPMGELISLQNLRCSPGRLGRLAVVHYSFVGHCLAFAATSARE